MGGCRCKGCLCHHGKHLRQNLPSSLDHRELSECCTSAQDWCGRWGVLRTGVAAWVAFEHVPSNRSLQQSDESHAACITYRSAQMRQSARMAAAQIARRPGQKGCQRLQTEGQMAAERCQAQHCSAGCPPLPDCWLQRRRTPENPQGIGRSPGRAGWELQSGGRPLTGGSGIGW